MNSVRFARRAIAYEVERQVALLEAGKTVLQQNPSVRSPDRYPPRHYAQRRTPTTTATFPDPDLPPVVLSQPYVDDELRATLGQLPWQAFSRLTDLGVDQEEARLIGEDRQRYLCFLDYAGASPAVPELAKLWVNRVLPALAGTEAPRAITALAFAQLQGLIADGSVSAANASSKLLPSSSSPSPVRVAPRAKELGLLQKHRRH